MKILLNKIKYHIFSFIIGAVTFYMFLSYSSVAGGKYIFLEGDGLETIGGIKECVRSLINGDNIYFSWGISLGMESLANYVTGTTIFSITAPLFIIFNKVDFAILEIISLSIKVGLASLCFFIFATRVFNIKRWVAVVFGLLYSMCGFQVFFNTIIYEWADAIFLLPLIILLIYELINNNRFIFIIVVYSYLFLNTYYMGYIIGIFSALYFLLLLLVKKDYSFKAKIYCCIKYTGIVLLAALMDCFALLPTGMFIFNNLAADRTVDFVLNNNIVETYSMLFLGANNGYINQFPYIYCGLLSLLVFPLFFINKDIDKKTKLIWGLLFLIMTVSLMFKPLFIFWHIFDVPDGWNFRFSYVISFIICVIAANVFDRLKEINYRVLIIAGLINIAIYISLFVFGDENYFSRSIYILILNIGFIILYLICSFLLKKIDVNNKNYSGIIVLLIFLSSVELIINGYIRYYGKEETNPTTYFEAYDLWNDRTSEAINHIEDDGFYRVDVIDDYIINSDLYFGYNGISDFSPFENYALRKTLGHLGVYSSARFTPPYGYTDFLKMILSVKYNVNSVSFDYYSDFYDLHSEVVENPYVLSLGFMVSDNILNYSSEGNDSFENINNLIFYMVDRNYVLYEKIQPEEINLLENGINVVLNDNNTLIYEIDEAEDDNVLRFCVPYDERRPYIIFDYGISCYDARGPVLMGGIENNMDIYGRMGAMYIKKMIREENNQYYYVDMKMFDFTYNRIVAPDNIYAYYYNENELSSIYNELKDNQMNVLDYSNGYVHSEIENSINGILFTSIPFNKYWHAYINGEETEIVPLLDGAFVGVKLSEGFYDIEFKYINPYINIAKIVSGFAFFIFWIISIAFLIWKYNRTKNKF